MANILGQSLRRAVNEVIEGNDIDANDGGFSGNVVITGDLEVDQIDERTGSNGITLTHKSTHSAGIIDSTLEDSKPVFTDGSKQLVSTLPATIDLGDGTLKIDNISESTTDHGVDIDGLVHIENSTIQIGGENSLITTKIGVKGVNTGTTETGPNFSFWTDADDYPLYTTLNFAHNNISWVFDAYHDGVWKSSSSNSNFRWVKASTDFQIHAETGHAPGGTIVSWGTADWAFDATNKDFKVYNGTVYLGQSTANRLVYTNGSRHVDSISDLTTWVDGGTNLTAVDDTDGTMTLNCDIDTDQPTDLGTGDTPTFADVIIDTDLSLKEAFEGLNEPNGFESHDDQTGSISTLTFTIAPTGASFIVYCGGRKFTKTSENLVLAGTEGIHLIYYDNDGVLQDGINQTESQIKDTMVNYTVVYCAIYDGSNWIYENEEFHSAHMDNMTHWYFHQAFGTQFKRGMELTSILTNEDGSLDTHAQFGVAEGEYFDEDQKHVVSAVASTVGLPVFYREGTNGQWRRSFTSGFSLINTASGRVNYNEWTGATWQQTEVTNADFAIYHIGVTDDKTYKYIVIQGQHEYNNVGNARDAIPTEINNITFDAPYPLSDTKFIGSIIIQTKNTYTNAVKARIRSIADGSDYYDLRRVAGAGGTAVVTSHTGLSDLDIDGHLQYVTLLNRGGETLDIDNITAEDIEVTNTGACTLTVEADSNGSGSEVPQVLLYADAQSYSGSLGIDADGSQITSSFDTTGGTYLKYDDNCFAVAYGTQPLLIANTSRWHFNYYGANSGNGQIDIDCATGSNSELRFRESGIMKSRVYLNGSDDSLYLECNANTGLYVNTSGQLFAPNLGSGTGTALHLSTGNQIRLSTSVRESKMNITDISDDWDWIYIIPTCKFKYRKQDENMNYLEESQEDSYSYGMIAQDVEVINPDLCTYNSKGELRAIKYMDFIAPLIEAVKSQKKKIEDLKTVNDQQQQLINDLLIRVSALEIK